MKFIAGGETFELSASSGKSILTKEGVEVGQGIPVFADPGAENIEHISGVVKKPAVDKAVYLFHHGECIHITPAINTIEG